ncbi:hypothetical protein COOONC_05588, partial [Cooperia oncophora]
MISSRARQIKESIGDLNSQMASGYYWYRIPLQINLPLQWMLMKSHGSVGACQGLAHFCEHMLFLGTDKYPEENEFFSVSHVNKSGPGRNYRHSFPQNFNL